MKQYIHDAIGGLIFAALIIIAGVIPDILLQFLEV